MADTSDPGELVAELRNEFGDPFSDVWGRTGADAWETVIGMFTQVGWTQPSTKGATVADTRLAPFGWPRPCVICGSMLTGHTSNPRGCSDVKR